VKRPRHLPRKDRVSRDGFPLKSLIGHVGLWPFGVLRSAVQAIGPPLSPSVELSAPTWTKNALLVDWPDEACLPWELRRARTSNHRVCPSYIRRE
jgi:hypothetical protein